MKDKPDKVNAYRIDSLKTGKMKKGILFSGKQAERKFNSKRGSKAKRTYYSM